jgi:hypothetical protein
MLKVVSEQSFLKNSDRSFITVLSKNRLKQLQLQLSTNNLTRIE